MVWVAGVDGCKDGWVAAFCDPELQRQPEIEFFAKFADILTSRFAPEIVAVDMPIGLPDRIEGAGRGPEQAARKVLGRRASSVFSIPSRQAVYAVTRPLKGMAEINAGHDQAKAVASRTSSPSKRCTRQAFMIFPKIREIDDLMKANTGLEKRVREVHPELAFWSMNGQTPLSFGKKSVLGRAERIALLKSEGISEHAILAPPPKGVKDDDKIDALAALIVAKYIAADRGRPFPEKPERDSHKIEIAIWTFVAGR